MCWIGCLGEVCPTLVYAEDELCFSSPTLVYVGDEFMFF